MLASLEHSAQMTVRRRPSPEGRPIYISFTMPEVAKAVLDARRRARFMSVSLESGDQGQMGPIRGMASSSIRGNM